MVPVFLSVCLSVFHLRDVSLPPLFHLQHLLSLSVSSLIFSLSHTLSLEAEIESASWPSAQHLRLFKWLTWRGGGKELWVESVLWRLPCTIVSLSAILWLFHSGFFCSWNRNIQVLRLITLNESVRDLTCLWSKERKIINEILSVSQLCLLDSYEFELRANVECSENFLLRKISYWWHFSREMRSQCLRFSIISNKSQSKWIYILK